MASLNLPHLAKLVNGPINHDANWTNMPKNIPSDIPMFKGKQRDDIANHVISFQLPSDIPIFEDK